ncbi:hypothetical protein KUL152_34840 [Tenacibaculum sp. KUL152]|jgi:hypothetical protein|nr:hypothetical protein KUL152_34840 [Tenacibaculum sp. KUL152]
MSKVLFVLLISVGVINFLPVIGVLSAAKLESAYSVKLLSNDLIILMRHRALLFGLIGGFLIYSAFVPTYRTAAMVLAGISMVGFVVLAHLTGEFNQSINKIVLVDYAGILMLAAAVGVRLFYART